MNKKLILLVAVLFVCVSLFAKQSVFDKNPGGPSFMGTGGPDAYGYTWIDSDEAGGPTYTWIDISGIGTEVTGLYDDNNVGPFNIGWNFPYYWYSVNQFWVNSNGAISFSDATVYTPQGSSTYFVPNTAAPNDLLIPLGADLAFDGIDTAKVYYYSNNVDTFIVSFINAAAWDIPGLVGAHTFQLVLSGQDSCIHFYYGRQNGAFYQNQDCSGIENVIGNVGLQVHSNQMPDSGYAVKFTPPDSTSYQALDIGLKDCLTPGSKGVFLFPNNPYTITARVKNYGNQDANNFIVSCLLWDTTYATHFTDSVSVTLLPAGAETTIAFTPNWTPTTVDNYLTYMQTYLGGDINPTNNSKDAELQVMTLPGWLMFDSDPTSGGATYWYGAGGGWGMEFTPPQYPITIDSILITLSSTNNCNVPFLFMDDDGNNGSPGTILFADTVYVPATAGFDYYVVPTGGITITSGKFYIGVIQVGDSFPSMIVDQNGPFSRCAWEYTGSWAEYRDKDAADVMMRAYSSSMQAVGEENDRPTYALSLLPARPNPVKDYTTIFYAIPQEGNVSLKVYNLIGQEVRTLVDGNKKPGIYSVQFKSEKLPQGVYFYRLTVGNSAVTRRLTILR